MMTLYLLFEAIDSGWLALDKKLRVSRRAAGQAPSKVGLRAGRTISVEQVVRALAVKSANDAATVAAEAVAGSEIKFARLMTQKARALGMRRTSFRNASGLPSRGQRSTARDMAILAKALLDDFAHHYHYFGQRTFAYAGRTHHSHNRLLGDYRGADGIKTGYIRASGFNLVVSVERDGVRLIGVVFGGRTARSRDIHMRGLLDRAWPKARRQSTLKGRPMPKPAARPRPAPALVAAAPRSAPPDTRRPSLPAVAHTAPPSPPAVPRDGVWAIQVGAFRGFAPAHRAAGRAALGLRGVPAGARLAIEPYEGRKGLLFRARIAGLGERDARHACQQLRRRGEACALVAPDGTVRLARAGALPDQRTASASTAPREAMK